MKEDIKRINCLIERCKQCKLNACITCDICWSEVQAIENLINRNKELEEKNKLLLNSKIGIDLSFDDYILKSKVETKKEEYKKLLMSCNRFSDVDRIKAINERILAYEELLEE